MQCNELKWIVISWEGNFTEMIELTEHRHLITASNAKMLSRNWAIKKWLLVKKKKSIEVAHN